VAWPPNIDVKNAPNEVKVQGCTPDGQVEENVTDGTVVPAVAVHDNRHCVSHDALSPTHDDARLGELCDPKPYQGHSSDLIHVHKHGEIAEKEQHLVVRVRRAAHIVEAGREIGGGEMLKEMEYEVDGANIPDDDVREDRQESAGVAQVGAGADCDELKAHGLDHRGLALDNDLLPSLAPKVFEAAYGDSRQE